MTCEHFPLLNHAGMTHDPVVLLPRSRCYVVAAEVSGVSMRIIMTNDGFGLMRFAHLAGQSDHL
jgi:hypothetical protein